MTGKPRPPGEVSKRVGQNLRTAREKRGLTQGELGEMIGGSYSMVLNLENARVQMRVEQLVDICQALRISPTTLLKGTL